MRTFTVHIAGASEAATAQIDAEDFDFVPSNSRCAVVFRNRDRVPIAYFDNVRAIITDAVRDYKGV